MHKVEKLKVWQRSIELAKEVYQAISELPNDETYGLSMQIKRSAVSIASNIAEGAGRNTNKEFNHFLGIANGSSYELQTQLLLNEKLSLIKKYNRLLSYVLKFKR